MLILTYFLLNVVYQILFTPSINFYAVKKKSTSKKPSFLHGGGENLLIFEFQTLAAMIHNSFIIIVIII